MNADDRLSLDPLGRAGKGHQRSFGANHARRPRRDVAAEDIENQIETSQQ